MLYFKLLILNKPITRSMTLVFQGDFLMELGRKLSMSTSKKYVYAVEYSAKNINLQHPSTSLPCIKSSELTTCVPYNIDNNLASDIDWSK